MEGDGLGASGVSRRTVLGVAAGGVAATALPAAIAAVSTSAGADVSAGEPGITAAVPLDNQMTSDAQWSDFLRGQDLLWRRMPTVWHEGAFLGDGRLGTMVY